MSQQQLLVAGDEIATASFDALVATAYALLREAADNARTGTAGASRDELIDQVAALQRVQNTAWAAQSIRLAEVSAIEQVWSPGDAEPREVPHAVGRYADEWVPQEIGTRLGWSDRQTMHRLTDAVDGIRCTPTMFELVMDGVLDPRKLTQVAEVLREAGPRAGAQVEAGLLATIDASASGADQVAVTSTKLIRRARRLLASVAPVAADASAAQQRATSIGVTAFPHHVPGLSVLQAVLPTHRAMEVMAGVNELARELHTDTTTGKKIDECRADAFCDLVLSKVSVSTSCVVQVPLRPVAELAVGASAGGGSGTVSAVGGSAAASPEGYDDWADLLGKFSAPVLVLAIGVVLTEQRTPAGSAAGVPRSGAPPHFPTGSGAGSSRSGPSPDVLSPSEAAFQRMVQLSTKSAVDRLRRLDTPRMNVVLREPVRLAAIGSGGSSGDHERNTLHPNGFRMGDVVVEGLGVIPAGVLVELCRAFGTKVSRALVDATTGTTVETADRGYRPGARLRRFVVARDQHCRFPGCTRPARLDDVDHVIRWPDGGTVASNLQCLCRHHHRAKHEAGWLVSMTAEGVCSWTSPSGRQYVTRPAD